MHRFFEVLRDLTRADAAKSRNWFDRTREEKRQTAPYALGWEDGYEAAYQQFLNFGEVQPLQARGATWGEASGHRA